MEVIINKLIYIFIVIALNFINENEIFELSFTEFLLNIESV